MVEKFRVGVIANTHGVSGEVKVFPTTDDVRRFKKLKKVILDTGKGEQVLDIIQVKFFKNMVILKFRQFQTLNEVELLKGKELYVTRDQAVKLEEDEFFVSDLIGLTAVSTEGERLGIVKDVLQTGANDVYVVETDAHEELLLPAIYDCVKDIDLTQGTMTVYLMPGLRD